MNGIRHNCEIINSSPNLIGNQDAQRLHIYFVYLADEWFVILIKIEGVLSRENLKVAVFILLEKRVVFTRITFSKTR